MSIPANVILGGDLDTIGRLRGGRFDDPFMPSYTRPYGEGMLLVIPPYTKEGRATYTVTKDMELHRVHFDTNKYTTSDDWSLYLNSDIDNNYIIKNYSQKNFTEGIQLMSVIKLKAGDTLTFKLDNKDSSTGVRAEISLSFLVKEVDSDSTSTKSDVIEKVEVPSLHISYNMFGDEVGSRISGTNMYDEATPFLVKEGKDFYKLITVTGSHNLTGEHIKSLVHNIPRSVKLYYENELGQEEVTQLQKNFVYVSIPDNVHSVPSARTSMLSTIEGKLSELDYFRNIPFRVRAIKESNLNRVIKVTIQ